MKQEHREILMRAKEVIERALRDGGMTTDCRTATLKVAEVARIEAGLSASAAIGFGWDLGHPVVLMVEFSDTVGDYGPENVWHIRARTADGAGSVRATMQSTSLWNVDELLEQWGLDPEAESSGALLRSLGAALDGQEDAPYGHALFLLGSEGLTHLHLYECEAALDAGARPSDLLWGMAELERDASPGFGEIAEDLASLMRSRAAEMAAAVLAVRDAPEMSEILTPETLALAEASLTRLNAGDRLAGRQRMGGG